MKLRQVDYLPPGNIDGIWFDDSEVVNWDVLADIPDRCIARNKNSPASIGDIIRKEEEIYIPNRLRLLAGMLMIPFFS
jgi:hypothetical protein